jgi:hypothetical protein
MRKPPKDFIGPLQPSVRERLAWAGIVSKGEQVRERSLLWRRRRKQLQKRTSR